ncbi:ATP-binding protein [Herbaspirillum sp. alder98]|uniref:ATP-binding protein n=1 Tax=Herbaspirillum sp. alder98 TaxID=2913096 RepID=UPI001CD8C6C5|nr:ATP-binding protein [Herbaspirillum sp. alder98]MCA1325782.1 ATP-binding protein [Herbaspirillum sp. alder98]
MNPKKNSQKYLELGKLLKELREKADFKDHKELAEAIHANARTVLSWENGISRPRQETVLQLQQLVHATDNALLTAAGFSKEAAQANEASTTTISSVFPLSSLTADDFEEFCATFLDFLYHPRGSEVHRYGATGHKQHGIDIVARGENYVHSFQCKRVRDFGAQKVHEAVKKQTYKASFKVLLLGYTASPDARDAIADYPGWQLWDPFDITRKIRLLPRFDQVALVDRFFVGKRLDLLGITEQGPIQSAGEFFAQFLVGSRYFNHAWTLIGRTDEVANAVAFAKEDDVLLTCISGPPGVGKSRVLREVVARLEADTSLYIRFVSAGETIKASHFEGVRAKDGGETLLIVDDAHDREDLPLLLNFASVPDNLTKLLFTTRPYGIEPIKRNAASAGVSGTAIKFIEILPPTKEQAQALAEYVLKQCNGPIEAAKAIAKVTFTTPLTTVLAAQLVAKHNIPLELLAQEEEFRIHVLRSLQQVIALELVQEYERGKLNAVLRTISLLQPVIQDDPAFLEILEKVEGVSKTDATRLMNVLNEAGVLFKRGIRSRLAPDLLADEIIRANYIDPNSQANALVEQIFEQLGVEHLKNMFLNLGRLDWRLREGKTDQSTLLTNIAPKLKWQGKYSNTHLKAAEAVAFYQPRFAMDFAKRLITEGHGDDTNVCNLLRYAAYTYDHVQEACSLLWRAGRGAKNGKKTALNPGMSVFADLAKYQVNKPLAYIDEVIDFVLKLLENPTTLSFENNPFCVLEGPLQTEYQSTTYSRLAFTIGRYIVSLSRVQSLRDKVTNALFEYLRSGTDRKAFLAVQTLSNALQGPMRAKPANDEWTHEHLNLLNKLLAIVEGTHVHAVVLVRIGQAVRWHAYYSQSITAPVALKIQSYLHRDLRTRLIRMLIDAWGNNTWKPYDGDTDANQFKMNCEATAKELIEAFPDIDNFYAEIQSALQEMSVLAPGFGTPYLFLGSLLDAVPGFAGKILRESLYHDVGPLNVAIGRAICIELMSGRNSLIADYVEFSRKSDEALMRLADGYAYFQSARAYTDEECSLFERIFLSENESVIFSAAQLSRQIFSQSPSLAFELICRLDFAINTEATHHIFMLLADSKEMQSLDVEEWRPRILQKLRNRTNLDDHWIRSFIVESVKIDAPAVMELVKARLKEACRLDDWQYLPLRKEHTKGIDLRASSQYEQLIQEFLDWVVSDADVSSRLSWIGGVFAGMCGNFDLPLLMQLREWMSTGTALRLELVESILKEAQPSLIFDFSDFIADILNDADAISLDALNGIRNAISISARSGPRSGTPGEPFPADVRLAEHCQKMLSSSSRALPTYDLYDELLRDAKREMSLERRARYSLDDDDD